MSRPPKAPDAIVLFELVGGTLDQKRKTVLSGYRPIYDVRPDYWTSVHHEFIDWAGVSTGGSGLAEVWFLSPEAYPKSLWIGRLLRVAEGSRVVGSARVQEIINSILVGSASDLTSSWEDNLLWFGQK
jgi:hypothetical protein